MAFTYEAGTDTDLNSIRLEISDTDKQNPLFQDEEINDLLDEEVSVLKTAARCCEILALRYARHFDFSADGSSFKKSQVGLAYERQALRLRARADGITVTMPERVDGYSDDIPGDQVDEAGNPTFDVGRWDRVTP